MLSKLGSSRRPIPPGVSLEHLRKPSIKPDPNSESIFVPDQPKTDDDPMDVDALGSNPGTVGSNPEATMHSVSVEMIAAISNWVDRIAVNTELTQIMPVETRSMRVAPRIQEPARTQAEPAMSDHG